MCSIITIDNKALNPERLERYLIQETMRNDDGMSIILQDPDGKLTSLKTFDLDTVLTLLDYSSWTRMWLHMRAATQGEVNLRNVHGWMTTDGTAVMHNGILSDKDAWDFNVDSELIVDWVEKFGVNFALDMLQTESYANVFLIEQYGDYHVSRTKSGSLFTDGNGNFATNQVGRINKPVKAGYQKQFKSGFVKPVVQEILNYEDYQYLNGILNKYRDDYGPSYISTTRGDYSADISRFNDRGSVLTDETMRTFDELSQLDESLTAEEYFTDDEYREYLDQGDLIRFEKKKAG